MEIKKTERASLENKRLLLAESGLVIALLAVYAGFETSTRAQEVAYLTDTTAVLDEDDILAVTLETPPPAPEAPALPQHSDEILIVEDDVTVHIDFQRQDDTDIPVDIQEYRGQEVVEVEVEEEELPFFAVEQKPSFQGGDANDFSRWVNARLQYPEIARENGVDGTVYLQFTISSDGRMQDVKVLRSPDESLAREAVRVVASSPKWEPGRQRDRAVKVSYIFPVVYRLR